MQYMLCMSGFVHETKGPESRMTRMYRQVRKVAALDAKTADFDCILFFLCANH